MTAQLAAVIIATTSLCLQFIFLPNHHYFDVFFRLVGQRDLLLGDNSPACSPIQVNSYITAKLIITFRLQFFLSQSIFKCITLKPLSIIANNSLSIFSGAMDTNWKCKNPVFFCVLIAYPQNKEGLVILVAVHCSKTLMFKKLAVKSQILWKMTKLLVNPVIE